MRFAWPWGSGLLVVQVRGPPLEGAGPAAGGARVSILRRYIVREFLLILLAALVGLLMLTLVGDAAERLNDFIDAGAPWRLVALFYLNQVPHYLMFTLPASSLIATLFTLGQMSRQTRSRRCSARGSACGGSFIPVFGVMLVMARRGFHRG